MKDRYKSLVVVFLMLTRTTSNGKEILLQLRKSTGYMDGHYDLGASGHLEEDESVKDAVIRESLEEANIKVEANNLKLVTVYDEKSNGLSYLRFFFHTEIYEGEISIGETDKCGEIGWYSIDNLPPNVIPHVRRAIENYIKSINYDENGFK
jgi:8-oxo-dGTP diphosphatase